MVNIELTLDRFIPNNFYDGWHNVIHVDGSSYILSDYIDNKVFYNIVDTKVNIKQHINDIKIKDQYILIRRATEPINEEIIWKFLEDIPKDTNPDIINFLTSLLSTYM